jgi:hypothetical protein
VGENIADNQRIAPCRSQEQTYPDSLPAALARARGHLLTNMATQVRNLYRDGFLRGGILSGELFPDEFSLARCRGKPGLSPLH